MDDNFVAIFLVCFPADPSNQSYHCCSFCIKFNLSYTLASSADKNLCPLPNYGFEVIGH